MRKRPIALPLLVHDFSHARVEAVAVGPRREVTLSVSPLVWDGGAGRYAAPVPVRFGEIENVSEVSAFFAGAPHARSELAWLRYADHPRSRPGGLFLELAFERVDVRIVVRCSRLMVGDPDPAR
ncbi:hypothetical protein GobsT_66930 [Gemmata obscuriglobus]|uniref:Uncharacterized protein n=1 Tax=Gemmata obscuriglobus TaxID=114 RepID=A0A2Z3GW69_9BACT|nr:hypothetical protein [Gemmata obscuriglobus]AWM35626.1 hypothetical protein C1280_00360 [Gemmata obscuriglobus]QEG31846.1 hypothetical protein GobsT_66930 [Gemmata obscuriglobus]VTS11192.1 unnamed protein product [Gemmata obscuriglobus UQM 2246]